jgi:hypothetical protein
VDESPSPAALALLAAEIRAERWDAEVEDGVRVRLSGDARAIPADGHVVGWSAGRRLFWYGRFANARDLVTVLRRVRRWRAVAAVGLALCGLSFAAMSARTSGPPSALAGLALVVGFLAFVVAWWRLRRLARRTGSVAWLRTPWFQQEAALHPITRGPG